MSGGTDLVGTPTMWAPDTTGGTYEGGMGVSDNMARDRARNVNAPSHAHWDRKSTLAAVRSVAPLVPKMRRGGRQLAAV